MRRLGYVPALDGIRGIAIVLVLLAHLHVPYVDGAGAAGVTMFFALSGFLITWLLCEEIAEHGRVSLTSFYRRRGLRLLPALFAMLTVVSLIAAWDRGLVRLSEIVTTLFYGENWWRIAGHPDSPLSHAWSLSVEEQFYLLWPIVLIVLYRRRMVLFAVLSAAIWAGTLEPLVSRVSAMHAAVGTDTRGTAILIGCAAALLVFHAERPVHVPLPAVMVSAAALLFCFLIANSRLTIVAVAVTIVITWIVVEGRKPRLLCSWPIRQTGRISYGLYVWHWPIIWIAVPHLTMLPPFPRGLLLAVAAFAVAIASYHWIERPFLRRKRLREQRPPVIVPVGEAA